MDAPQASPHLPIRPQWLALHDEAALEPELPIIDAHHHLWDHAHNPYGPPDLLADVSGGHRVVATVFIECSTRYRQDGPPAFAALGETQYVNDVAARSQGGPCRIAAGIVGYANLQLGAEVAAVLDAQAMQAPGRFKGVRNTSVYHPDPSARGSLANPPPGLLLDAAFRRGFACLAPRGLSFDAWLYHTQLAELEDLARAFPETAIILNHMGGPIGIGPYQHQRSAVFAEWNRAIARLARCENVFVKVGGLGMRLFGFDLANRDKPASSEELARAWAPYVMACVDAFGPSRCMLESNFPVDKGTGNYRVIWNALKRATQGLGEPARRALFHDTAARVYRIAPALPA